MKDRGNLPDNFKQSYETLEADYQLQNYAPMPPLLFVWKNFWKIRFTKTYESPINHTDLVNFQSLYKTEFTIWEVETILKFDNAYYRYSQKHKEK